ncbi:MAG: hypothetical protein Q8934_14385 [Bacillota bacterium]|nr:hypothetical protein [Bacillota bacterium]
MKPPFKITLDFANLIDESTYLIISADNEEAWIRIRKEGDDDYTERSIMLDPQEIDVLVSALNLFKYRILNPKRSEADEC